MPKTPNTHGGGAQTNVNGLHFEQTTRLDDVLSQNGYVVQDNNVYEFNEDGKKEQVGYSVPQHSLYKRFLEPRGVDYKDVNSKRWHPDECFINERNKTAYIIEKKFQNSSGSVDEKLPGCDFKKKQYEKLLSPLGYTVEFSYVFNDWFKQDVYRDTLDYIEAVGCHYYHNSIPVNAM